MRLAHEFLQNFCAGNQQNQALLHKHINLFLNPGVRPQARLEICEGRAGSSKRNSLFFCCGDHRDLLKCDIHSKRNIWTNSREDINTPHLFRGEGREREEEVIGQGKMYFFLTFFITSNFSPRELLIVSL